MALIENNASMAAEIAVNFAKKSHKSTPMSEISKCLLVPERNPVSNVNVFKSFRRCVLCYTRNCLYRRWLLVEPLWILRYK